MRRLDNGDKLKRRKTLVVWYTFGAAKRTYEAIIWLRHEQLVCARAKCTAAEAERDASKAELHLNERLQKSCAELKRVRCVSYFLKGLHAGSTVYVSAWGPRVMEPST